MKAMARRKRKSIWRKKHNSCESENNLAAWLSKAIIMKAMTMAKAAAKERSENNNDNNLAVKAEKSRTVSAYNGLNGTLKRQ